LISQEQAPVGTESGVLCTAADSATGAAA